MTALLEQIPDRGYPADYLVSRVHGRRSFIVKDWKTLLADPQSIERLSSGRFSLRTISRSPEILLRDLLHEYRWVYSQMNGALRETFTSFFFYNELRTIFVCIRLLGKRDTGEIATMLEQSILPRPIKRIMIEGRDRQTVFRSIESFFGQHIPVFAGISDVFTNEGLRSAEKTLTNRYLRYVAKQPGHPVLRVFFSYIIDARNIITLYKAIRHTMAGEPVFLEGGTLPVLRLTGVYRDNDILALPDLISPFTGMHPDRPDPSRVERDLYAGITRRLLRSKKTDPVVGNILHYLWQRSLEITNLGLIFQAGSIDRETLVRELVS